MADFIGNVIGGNTFFTLTDDLEFYRGSEKGKINYSGEELTGNEFLLKPHPILFEKGISDQALNFFTTNNYPAFFKTSGHFPFDIFAASFYLISRYEEYLPHQKDNYGRYAHENSIAFRQNFLHLPLINIWINDFKQSLQDKFPELDNDPSMTGRKQGFTFLPTYDIDEAYSYKHKERWKNAVGLIRAFARGEWKNLGERIRVLSGKQEDPYDAYQWMDQLHHRFQLKPYYFFILAEKPGRYDKNLRPDRKPMQELIRQHYYKYPLGIHPSWQSGDDISLIKKEKEQLARITGGDIRSSRQHYIRFTLPQTFRYIIEAGIEYDFSMGYGSINGFRASVASPFYWYDLEKETVTGLLLYPFCFMDANSFFEQKYNAEQAYREMKHYYETVKAVNGMLITIWHNNFLGTFKNYPGWREAYERFIMESTGQAPSGSNMAAAGIL